MLAELIFSLLKQIILFEKLFGNSIFKDSNSKCNEDFSETETAIHAGISSGILFSHKSPFAVNGRLKLKITASSLKKESGNNSLESNEGNSLIKVNSYLSFDKYLSIKN